MTFSGAADAEECQGWSMRRLRLLPRGLSSMGEPTTTCRQTAEVLYPAWRPRRGTGGRASMLGPVSSPRWLSITTFSFQQHHLRQPSDVSDLEQQLCAPTLSGLNPPDAASAAASHNSSSHALDHRSPPAKAAAALLASPLRRLTDESDLHEARLDGSAHGRLFVRRTNVDPRRPEVAELCVHPIRQQNQLSCVPYSCTDDLVSRL